MIWILTGLAVLAAVGVVIYLVSTKKSSQPPLTFRHAVTTSKTALLNKEKLPEIFRRMPDKSETPFIALEQNKKKAEIPGTYIFRWPDLQITYTNSTDSEKVVMQLAGYDEKVTAFYSTGNINGVKIGDESLNLEDFEMRHAGTVGEHLRSFIRYHLRFPEGSLKVDKAPEPTFKPVLDLNKGGEIHLHGKPPPGTMPNFKKESDE